MTISQGIELGPISLPIFRMLLLVGIVRVCIKQERLEHGFNSMDKLICVFGIWIVFASFFHTGGIGSGPVYVSGLVFNLLTSYFLIRIWCTDLREVSDLIAIVAFLLLPIACEMLLEKVTKVNQFSVFGGVPHGVTLREGKYRAQGPFGHPILGGTVGAVCVPLFLGIWKRYRVAALVGIGSGICITIASASSGPIMSLFAGTFAVIMWRFRSLTWLARIGAVAAYFGFQLMSGQPGYYVMSRIDISGGSTGYFRARLIESAFQHFDEWWLFGTDFTRHWMPTGVTYSPDHTDITNYYLGFGVTAGFFAIVLLIAILIVSFRWVGVVCRAHVDESPSDAFMIWCLGAGMFAHAATSVSVSYFDQSLIFFWMNLAVIGSMYSGHLAQEGFEAEADGEVEGEPSSPSRVMFSAV